MNIELLETEELKTITTKATTVRPTATTTVEAIESSHTTTLNFLRETRDQRSEGK
jgi:hypothetical protein